MNYLKRESFPQLARDTIGRKLFMNHRLLTTLVMLIAVGVMPLSVDANEQANVVFDDITITSTDTTTARSASLSPTLSFCSLTIWDMETSGASVRR